MSYSELRRLVDEVRSTGPGYSIENDRGLARVESVLKDLLAEPWEGDAGPHVRMTDEDVLGQTEGSFQPLLHSVNAYLKEAARRLGAARTPTVSKSRGVPHSCHVWFKPDGVGSRRLDPGYRRITVLGKLWETDGSVDFMQGAQAMADELGVELLDEREQAGSVDASPFARAGSSLEEQIARHRLDPREDAILIPFDKSLHLDLQVRRSAASGFRVVTAGRFDGDVRIDEEIQAKLLAMHCIEAEGVPPGGPPPPRKVVFSLRFEWANTVNASRRRAGIFGGILEQSGLFDVEHLELRSRCDPPYTDAAREAVTVIKRNLKRFPDGSLAAIFPGPEEVGRAVVAHASSLDPPPRVYAERITTRDLRSLCDPASPLAAVCGIPFCSFGRYAVRVASYPPDKITSPLIVPIRIDKAEAIEKGLNSIDRVLNRLGRAAPKLDGPEYANPGRR